MPVGGEVATVAPVIAQVRLLTALQRSEYVGFGVVTDREQAPAEVVVTIFAGQVMEGGCPSVMVTVKLHVAEFPCPVPQSIAVYVMVDTPRLNVLGEGTYWISLLLPELPIGPAPDMTHLNFLTLQLSVKVGWGNVTEAVQLPGVVAWVMLGGQVMEGSCVSVTVTVNEQVELLPATSRAV